MLLSCSSTETCIAQSLDWLKVKKSVLSTEVEPNLSLFTLQSWGWSISPSISTIIHLSAIRSQEMRLSVSVSGFTGPFFSVRAERQQAPLPYHWDLTKDELLWLDFETVSLSDSYCISQRCMMDIKYVIGIVITPTNYNLSSNTHPHVVPNHDCLLWNTKGKHFEECTGSSFLCNYNQ